MVIASEFVFQMNSYRILLKLNWNILYIEDIPKLSASQQKCLELCADLVSDNIRVRNEKGPTDESHFTIRTTLAICRTRTQPIYSLHRSYVYKTGTDAVTARQGCPRGSISAAMTRLQP